MIGRLRPEATTDGMDLRLTTSLRQWMRTEAGYPSNWMPEIERKLPEQVITVVPAGAGVGLMKEQYGRSLRILLAVCGLVLLIACANVANLLLARAMTRRGQTAVRLAIGASRGRIVTEALVESVVLAIGGGLAGLLVAMGAARLLLSLAFAGATMLPITTTPSPLVLAFAAGLALLTGVLFGAAPAWFATRTDPIEAMRGASRAAGDRALFTRTDAARGAGHASRGARRWVDDAGPQPRQPGRPGLRVRSRWARIVSVGRPSASFTGARLTALYRDVEARLAAFRRTSTPAVALYNPLTSNWGEGASRGGQAGAGAWRGSLRRGTGRQRTLCSSWA